MLRYVVSVILFGLGGLASAHQFLPTYPTFQHSFIQGVVYAKMELFNKRKEVEYYELGVFDANWSPVTFASENKIIQIGYLQTKYINVYLRKEDLTKAAFICTESKFPKRDEQAALISSRICSKIK